MFARRMVTVISVLVLATACNPFRNDPAVQVTTKDTELNTRWHANLASPAALAGVVQMNGSASMAPNASGNGTIITVSLANAVPGGRHPWSAHLGQCGDGTDNGMIGESKSYEALKVDRDGGATGTASVAMQTPTIGDYFVVIRASTANDETVVACGNLAPPTR